jgi:hypothetical protein
MIARRFAVSRAHGLGLLALVTVGLLPSAVRAEDVQVTVLVILASETDAKVDPRLQCVAQQVRKNYPELKGFRLEEILRKSLPVGKKDTFVLIGNQKATVVVQHGCDKEDKVGLSVKVPNFGELEYKTCCGKFLALVTDHRTKDKERLIVAVRVQPCKKADKQDK